MRKLKLTKLKGDEKAVSEVIGTILIFTILIAFVGLLQVYSVPVWNEEIEFAHYNIIFNDVLELKKMIPETAVYDLPRTSVLHTSLDYPNRFVLLNPGKPSATVTTKFDKQITITYDGNVTERMNSCTIRIEEHYNYFDAPALVIEHGMIIGQKGDTGYIIDDPLFGSNNMDIPFINCDNTSVGTTSSLALHVYPFLSRTITVSNASLSFYTDYPELWGKYLDSIGADFNISGNTARINYNNVTKIRAMGVNIASPSNLTIIPVGTPTPVVTPVTTPVLTATPSSTPGATPLITPAPLIIDSFETVGDKGYSRSGSGEYEQNSDIRYVSYQTGSLQMKYDFTSKNTNEWLTVDINYNRYSPQRSFNISRYPYLKLDIYANASNYSAAISIRGGSKTYEWAPVVLNWSGWKTVSFPLPLAAGVDLEAVNGVAVKLIELDVPGNREGTIYFDYLKGSY